MSEDVVPGSRYTDAPAEPVVGTPDRDWWRMAGVDACIDRMILILERAEKAEAELAEAREERDTTATDLRDELAGLRADAERWRVVRRWFAKEEWLLLPGIHQVERPEQADEVIDRYLAAREHKDELKEVPNG
jgi:hypothetical protein